MGATGLFLCSFLVVHLYGNLLLYGGQEYFEEHAHKFSSNIIIRIIEVLLFLAIVLHAASGLWVAIQNRKARPVRYAANHRSAGGRTLASRTMVITGSAIFIYLVIHLRQFFYESRIGPNADTVSLYELVSTTFRDPAYAILYVVAMILLAGHLVHGFQSGFKSLGLHGMRYASMIKVIGLSCGVLVPAGFASLPIYFFFSGTGP
jgi:succinate dehydrogenase / fumarate reductase cytochrome b subunit